MSDESRTERIMVAMCAIAMGSAIVVSLLDFADCIIEVMR